MSGPAHPTHELQRGDVPYEAPFIRSASPNDSLTTAYGPDETNLSDVELSDDAFSKKVLAGLRVHEKRDEEEYAETRPLLMPRPRRGAATNSCSTSGEERVMHEQVMRSLRWHVRLLEEEEVLETALQRRIRAIQETQSLTSDIDTIMESMMEVQSKPLANSDGMCLDQPTRGGQRQG